MVDQHRHHRRSIRAPGFDYRDAGTYFATICTRHREHLFGEIRNGVMGLNECGRVVADEIRNTTVIRPYVHIDTWVVMPNHVHLLMHIDDSQSWNGRGMARHAPTTTAIGGSPSALRKPTPPSSSATTINGSSSTSRKPTQPSLSATAIDGSTPSFGKPQSRSLSTIVGAFKSAVTRRINSLRDAPGTTVWQRNFHEHIVRSTEEYDRIRTYILNNPSKWLNDRNNRR